MELIMNKQIDMALLKAKYKDAGLELKSDESFLALDGYIKDGTFDYEKYVQIQTVVNKHKIDQRGVEICKNPNDFMANFAIHNTNPIKFGICHGTRRGDEQVSLGNRFNIPTIGTEISDNADQFPNTIQWDFHDIKEEWIDNTSIIYSNSFDHAFDPIYALGNWMRCIHKTGFIILRAFGKDYDPKFPKYTKSWDDWMEPIIDGKLPYKLSDLHGYTPESIIKMVVYNHNQGVIDINEWTLSLAPAAIILFRGSEDEIKYDWDKHTKLHN